MNCAIYNKLCEQYIAQTENVTMIPDLIVITAHIAKSFEAAIAPSARFKHFLLFLAYYHFNPRSDIVGEERDHHLLQPFHKMLNWSRLLG